MTDIHDIWQKTTAILRTTLSEDTYDRSIAHIVPVRVEAATLVLGVSFNVFCEWLANNYQDLIVDTLFTVTGKNWKVVFESGHQAPKLASETAASESKASASKVKPGITVAPPRRRGARKPVENRSSFNRNYTFDRFVVGENSRFAHAACQAIASSPGTAYNPLFIHSPTGLGKTHLLHAVAQDVLQRSPQAKVEYACSEDFCNHYINALREKSLPKFREHFRHIDVLLIDDIQFLKDKKGIQEEFFHTFNSLYHSHKQLVFTSDRPPNEIDGLEKRLVSRFEWGLTTDIQVPNLETRMAILQQKQSDHSYSLSNEVLHYIALRLKSSVRRLEGALVRLVSYASLSGNIPITIETAEQLLCNLFNEEASTQVTVEEIQRLVADFYDIRFADMTSKRRPANIAFPRQVAMYLSRKLTELSLSAIAEMFNRNHATIIHAVDSVNNRLQDNQELQREVALIERRLKNL